MSATKRASSNPSLIPFTIFCPAVMSHSAKKTRKARPVVVPSTVSDSILAANLLREIAGNAVPCGRTHKIVQGCELCLPPAQENRIVFRVGIGVADQHVDDDRVEQSRSIGCRHVLAGELEHVGQRGTSDARPVAFVFRRGRPAEGLAEILLVESLPPATGKGAVVPRHQKIGSVPSDPGRRARDIQAAAPRQDELHSGRCRTGDARDPNDHEALSSMCVPG